MNLEKICKNICDLSIETGEFLRMEVSRITSSQIESKGMHDYVTYVDRGSEKRLVAGLKKIIPAAGFLTEEKTVKPKQLEYTWIVDPLDGTTNFIHGVPCYSISIALMRENKLLVSVIFEINLKECFYGWEGGGAFLNGIPIHVSKILALKDALLATGFPYYDYSRLDGYMNLFIHFLKHSHGVRRLGSAAVDLAYVACGRFDGFYEYGLSPWDVAAGAMIVQCAGGDVSDFSGGKNFIFGKEIIASSEKIHTEFVKTVKKFIF